MIALEGGRVANETVRSMAGFIPPFDVKGLNDITKAFRECPSLCTIEMPEVTMDINSSFRRDSGRIEKSWAWSRGGDSPVATMSDPDEWKVNWRIHEVSGSSV